MPTWSMRKIWDHDRMVGMVGDFLSGEGAGMKSRARLLRCCWRCCCRLRPADVPPGVTELTYATPLSARRTRSAGRTSAGSTSSRSESGGSCVIRPIWSGALLSADMSMEELRHGVADIGLITPIYVARRHASDCASRPASTAAPIRCEEQVALYRCMRAQQPADRARTDGLKVLAVQGGPAARHRHPRQAG